VVLSAFASSDFEDGLTAVNFASATIKRISSSGLVQPVNTDSLSYVNGTATLTIASLSSNFVSGDKVAIFLSGPPKAYDIDSDWLSVNLAAFIAGEDEDRDVMKVESQNGYFHISEAGTHLVKTGSGHLSHILVTGGSAGTILVYDSPTAPGEIIASFDSTNSIATYTFDALFSEGLTVVTSANTKLTVFSN
jgi:hypothetical protein